MSGCAPARQPPSWRRSVRPRRHPGAEASEIFKTYPGSMECHSLNLHCSRSRDCFRPGIDARLTFEECPLD